MIGEISLDGYILEVDFIYPDELYELRNDYPLVPENLKLVMICFQNIVVLLQKIGGVKKLVPNLGNKVNVYFITRIYCCIFD